MVGAITSTFPSGNFSSLEAATSIAIIVFPNPVGRTTSVFEALAVSAIFLWYSRGSKPPVSII